MTAQSDETLHRRLTAATLDVYFRNKVPVTLAVEGLDGVRLVIDGKAETLSLWVPVDGDPPEVEGFERLELDIEETGGGGCHVVTAHAERDHFETYSLLAAVVESMVRGMSLRTALADAVATYRGLLSSRGRLSPEKTAGIIGELLVLEHLLTALPEAHAMASWVGPDAEEHDFVLSDMDLEVKTTTSERRVHMIGSETQLTRTGARPLWLISLQLTRGGRAARAFTLPDVVGRIRGRLAAPDVLDIGLAGVGYRTKDAGLYRDRYLVRTTPRAYLVDDDFPAISRARLEASVPSAEYVAGVSYRIDVTTLGASLPPEPMDKFVEVEK